MIPAAVLLHKERTMHAKLWSDMFVLGLPVLEKILRPLIVYGFLIVALRLAGKRELAQLNPFDLVVLLTLSNTVQNAIIGDDNTVTGGLIGAATLLVVNYVVVRSLYGHGKLERIMEGDEDVLIEKGRVLKRRLKKELITLPELEAAAHRQGFASLADVERAVLEPGGTLSFIAKQPAPEETRHREVLERLERLAQELAQLRAKPSASES
jgi:uncharacterized membrane protein YcaP (DUF421 family)